MPRTCRSFFSVECWGGATFDVAYRFLQECPWQRLRDIRAAMPNIMTQMLLRGANGVGYTNYPDNVVKAFVKRAAESGVDVFRIFDSLNWVENMRVSMDAVLETGRICEGTICYTGNVLDPDRAKYDLKYYVKMAKELEAAGAHVLGLKDMAGLLKPAAAAVLIPALKDAVDLPIHFHTHDTAGIACGTILEASAAGVDCGRLRDGRPCQATPARRRWARWWRPCASPTGIPVSISGRSARSPTTGRPCAPITRRLNRGCRRPPRRSISTRCRAGSSPTSRRRPRSMGLEDRWHEVAQMYADVNQMFGDIVKVTPSSKVVGDMALMMVSQGPDARGRGEPRQGRLLPRQRHRHDARQISASRRAAFRPAS